MVAYRGRRAVALLSVLMLLVATLYIPRPAGAGGLPPGGTFEDDNGNTHEGMIEAIVAEGITLGCNADPPLYCPADDVRRDQMASFLARALKLPASTTNWFPDDNGNTHEGAINSIADAGITLGFADGTYGPSGFVSRAQMASFLKRALGLPDSTTDWFMDDDGNTHEGAINSIADDGVTLGCDANNNYCPTDNVRRDQMASFLGRALDLDEIFPPPPGGTTTTTVSSDTTAPTWPGGSVLSVTGTSDVVAVVDWSANPATDNVGVFEYDIYVDDVFDQTVSGTSATVLGLSASTMYTIRVEARDVAGNRSTDGPEATATTAAGPDTEDPTWPGGAVLSVTGKSDTTMVVDWSANVATDNVGVFEYNVYLDDVFDQTVTGTSATVTGLVASMSYTIRVEAADAAGNESTDGPEVTDTTSATPDTEDPTWPGGAVLSVTGVTETTAVVNWSANPATDNVGVLEYDVYRNGALNTTVSTLFATVTGLSAGMSYTITVEARDAAGNDSSDGPSVLVTADDTTAPTWTAGSVSVTDTTETSISVSWTTAADNVGVVGYRVYDNPGATTTHSTSSDVGLTTTHTVTGLTASTQYTIHVEAYDLVGNESTDGPSVTTSTAATTTTTMGGGSETVTLTNFVFTSSTPTVTQGTEVTFDNTQGNHSLTWETGSYPGQVLQFSPWDVTFTADTTGTFAFYCTLHGGVGGAGMSGTLTVNP